MASKGNILRGHHSEPDAGYEKSLPDAALTVGSVSRAMSDAKAALAETRNLEDRVDDIDGLIAEIEKSSAAHAALTKSIEAGAKATADQIAKLAAEVDTKGTLAKCAAWEKAFFARQHAAEHGNESLEDFMARIEADTAAIRKRDEVTKYDFDDDGSLSVERRPDAMWKVVR